MRCKIDNWRFDQGTICPNCGFDNPVEEIPVVNDEPHKKPEPRPKKK